MSDPSRALKRTRCLHHPTREAAVRCPECGQDFCRECSLEHEGRFLCRSCLEKTASRERAPQQASWFSRALQFALTTLSIVFIWFFYYAIGEILVHLPDEFHDTIGFWS